MIWTNKIWWSLTRSNHIQWCWKEIIFRTQSSISKSSSSPCAGPGRKKENTIKKKKRGLKLRVAAKFQNVCFPLSSKSRVGCTHTPWSKRNLKRKNMLWNVKHKVTCFVPISIDILVLLFLPPRKSWKEQPTACPYLYIYIYISNKP